MDQGAPPLLVFVLVLVIVLLLLLLFLLLPLLLIQKRKETPHLSCPLQTLQAGNPNQPLIWTEDQGWFDQWGVAQRVRYPRDQVATWWRPRSTPPLPCVFHCHCG